MIDDPADISPLEYEKAIMRALEEGDLRAAMALIRVYGTVDRERALEILQVVRAAVEMVIAGQEGRN